MKRLLGVYTSAFNHRHQRVGHFLELSRYIHLNSCRAGLAKRPEAYPWSSMQFFLGEKPPQFLDRDFLHSPFEDREAYRGFVMEKITAVEDLRPVEMGEDTPVGDWRQTRQDPLGHLSFGKAV